MMASQWKDGDLIQDWESSPYLEKLLPIYWVTQKLFSVSGPLMVGILCFCRKPFTLLYFNLHVPFTLVFSFFSPICFPSII